MNRGKKRITMAALALVMAFALVIGAIGTVGLLGGPTATVQVLGSDGGYVPPSPSSSSSSGSTATKKAKKKAAPKKKLSVSGKKVTADGAALQTGNVTFAKKKILIIKNAGGKTTYTIKNVSGGAKKFFKINKKGKLTVKKGIKPGKTYTVKIKVATKGNKKCRAGSKLAKVKVTVTQPPAPTPAPAPTPEPTPTPTPEPSDGLAGN